MSRSAGLCRVDGECDSSHRLLVKLQRESQMKKLVLCIVLAGLAGCGKKPEPLPVYGQVPNFVLTSQAGEEFDGKSLQGKVWVADFIFTNCTGPCPRMSWQMKQIQQAIKDLPDVKLVSFTVDPVRDTPEVLAVYAKRYEAEAGRWYFLTGPQATLQQLSRDALKLGDVDGSLNHNTHFVLVDQRARVRGYYGTSEGDALKQLVADIRRLVRESS
jgi:protein SCO1/2